MDTQKTGAEAPTTEITTETAKQDTPVVAEKATATEEPKPSESAAESQPTAPASAEKGKKSSPKKKTEKKSGEKKEKAKKSVEPKEKKPRKSRTAMPTDRPYRPLVDSIPNEQDLRLVQKLTNIHREGLPKNCSPAILEKHQNTRKTTDKDGTHFKGEKLTFPKRHDQGDLSVPHYAKVRDTSSKNNKRYRRRNNIVCVEGEYMNEYDERARPYVEDEDYQRHKAEWEANEKTLQNHRKDYKWEYRPSITETMRTMPKSAFMSTISFMAEDVPFTQKKEHTDKNGKKRYITGAKLFSSEDIRAVVGLVVDLDQHDPAVDVEDLKKMVQATVEFLHGLWINSATKLPTPAIEVSGRGIHLWWIFTQGVEYNHQDPSNSAWYKALASKVIAEISPQLENAPYKLDIDSGTSTPWHLLNLPGGVNPKTNTVRHIINDDWDNVDVNAFCASVNALPIDQFVEKYDEEQMKKAEMLRQRKEAMRLRDEARRQRAEAKRQKDEEKRQKAEEKQQADAAKKAAKEAAKAEKSDQKKKPYMPEELGQLAMFCDTELDDAIILETDPEQGAVSSPLSVFPVSSDTEDSEYTIPRPLPVPMPRMLSKDGKPVPEKAKKETVSSAKLVVSVPSDNMDSAYEMLLYSMRITKLENSFSNARGEIIPDKYIRRLASSSKRIQNIMDWAASKNWDIWGSRHMWLTCICSILAAGCRLYSLISKLQMFNRKLRDPLPLEEVEQIASTMGDISKYRMPMKNETIREKLSLSDAEYKKFFESRRVAPNAARDKARADKQNERYARVVWLYGMGKTQKQIADTVHITIKTVRHVLFEAGQLSDKTVTRDEVLRFYSSGKTQKEIAKIVGMNRDTVSVILRTANVAGKKHREDKHNQIAVLKEQGLTQKEVAERTGVSLRTVKRYWNQKVSSPVAA